MPTLYVRCPNTCPHGDRCKFDVYDHPFDCSMLVCPCNEGTAFARANTKAWDGAVSPLLNPSAFPHGQSPTPKTNDCTCMPANSCAYHALAACICDPPRDCPYRCPTCHREYCPRSR